MEQLQIQSLPNSTAILALQVVWVLGRWNKNLIFALWHCVSVMTYTDGTLEQHIGMRQISATVKDSDSHSWFVACNERLHKYSLPNIYTDRPKLPVWEFIGVSIYDLRYAIIPIICEWILVHVKLKTYAK